MELPSHHCLLYPFEIFVHTRARDIFERTKMATVFGIYEDIENVQDQPKKDLKVFNAGKNNGNDKEKRPTFAILNNVAYDGRNGAHAQKMVIKTKDIMQQT